MALAASAPGHRQRPRRGGSTCLYSTWDPGWSAGDTQGELIPTPHCTYTAVSHLHVHSSVPPTRSFVLRPSRPDGCTLSCSTRRLVSRTNTCPRTLHYQKQTTVLQRDNFSRRVPRYQWNTVLTRQHVTTNCLQREISDCHSSTTGRGRIRAAVRANQRRQCLLSTTPGHASYSIPQAARQSRTFPTLNVPHATETACDSIPPPAPRATLVCPLPTAPPTPVRHAGQPIPSASHQPADCRNPFRTARVHIVSPRPTFAHLARPSLTPLPPRVGHFLFQHRTSPSLPSWVSSMCAAPAS